MEKNTGTVSDKFIKKLTETKIRELLTAISIQYPTEFKKSYIKSELEYILKHVTMQNLDPIKLKESKAKYKAAYAKKRQNASIISDSDRCTGRVWGNIFEIKDNNILEPINTLPSQYKVINFDDIDLDEFNSTYVIGNRCKTKKIGDKYCKRHSEHLIHGDFFEKPSAELCFHYIKDNKLL